jgi:integrase
VLTREDGSQVIEPRKNWYTLCVTAGMGQFVQGKNRYCRYVGLNLHDFRRSAIRNMRRRGVDSKTAMEISGHKTFAVFQRYNIVDETDLIRASELIEAGDHQVPEQGTKTDTETDTSALRVS